MSDDAPPPDRPPYQPPEGEPTYSAQPYPYSPQPGSPGQYGPPPGETPPRVPGAGRVRVGDRGFARPVPRFGVVLAGSGIGLAVLGAFVWSSNVVDGGDGGSGGSPDSSRRLLGVVLMAALIVAGYLVAVLGRRGPLVNAGVAASAFGVPVLLVYATLHNPKNFDLPINLDVVALVSIAIWLLAYLFAPVVAGHTLYVGLAAVDLWLYLMLKSEPNLIGFPFLTITATINGEPPPTLDLSTIATLSIVTGLAYYLVAFLLDRVGRPGPAVPLVVAGVPATTFGLLASTKSLHQTGTGVVAIIVGVLLVSYGVSAGRRFTAWYWGLWIAVGALLIVADNIKDNAAASGITLIVLGAIVILTAHLLARVRDEPDEVPPRAAQ